MSSTIFLDFLNTLQINLFQSLILCVIKHWNVFFTVTTIFKFHSLENYQALFFSYPSLTSKSPVTSLNNSLCSSVKNSRQPPVFPARKV